MNLVFLDCDANSPEDLEPANIHPQIIYIHIVRQKVLHKLIQEMTANSRERDEQLQQAYHLYEKSVSYCMLCVFAVVLLANITNKIAQPLGAREIIDLYHLRARSTGKGRHVNMCPFQLTGGLLSDNSGQ